jgi:hypothetical protein
MLSIAKPVFYILGFIIKVGTTHMEVNDDVKRERIDTIINDNLRIADEQSQSDLDQYGEDFDMLVKSLPPPGGISEVVSRIFRTFELEAASLW